MEKFHDRLLEMLNPGRSGGNAASQPEYDAKTESPPVGSHYEVINAVDKPLRPLLLPNRIQRISSMSARINAICVSIRCDGSLWTIESDDIILSKLLTSNIYSTFGVQRNNLLRI
jgi:hypothetical protein